MDKYRSLPYYGGKRCDGKGEWIASLLPWARKSVYIEPFAGMAGVLLSREPVKTEILNDLNGRVINWWRAVRDYPEEFGRLVELTPHSREEYRWAIQAVDDEGEPPLRRALAFHILVSQSVSHGDAIRTAGTWRRVYSSNREGRRLRAADINSLTTRLGEVLLENTDALTLLERTARVEEAVIYADPPYPSANTTAYSCDAVDYPRLAELLQAQRGAVALSGHPGEWDTLGWAVETRGANWHCATGETGWRTECLWRNERCVELTAARRLL